ncbi:bifunctional proline dehydrogenase/L-glutamate gamma-semialdehyde dehydrogenase [Rothia sp. ZJ932]|uniref:bifunctional proline dehydrogenase/L-glutamate gamma-semialdehyde dehydrogenase n=1 Tax=Rothia sp. ZJ932 TaxID=2810516 RepID=UPI001968183F|nr:bifunctional proline dehydrogenase/L-glutamate gamma-semialdehyde dehydrogenase [Rothia sp. ZJ932]QRZ60959.1 bifunctional proline dehydrogenase/L-glutamate gamma-semialdehyde dehydrogenase [Rothia sp. ZJ932]
MNEKVFASAHYQQMAQEAVSLVENWVKDAQNIPADASAQKLAGVLKDPNGLEFTVGFVDGVVRPEDKTVAGKNLARIAPLVPGFLPWYMKSAVNVGGKLASQVSTPTVDIARKVLRQMVGHLIVDARDEKLGPAIEHLTSTGNKLNINLLGEAVLGDKEAARRLSETKRLLARDDIDYVSIKVSSVLGPHSHWAFDEAVDHAVKSLTPLYELAANSPVKKFINLDMEEYKDLDMTIEVFTKILDQPHLKDLEAGIVLQAYLPDTLDAMMRLQKWAAARVADGGSRIKVRLVKGANLSMEVVEGALHGWPLTTWDSKQLSDTNYKRILDYALQPEHAKNIRLGVAGHNLFDVAFALLLAEDRGVADSVEFEMLIGMAAQQAEIIRRRVGHLLLYTPVVRPEEFDVAISYLVRRLEENASSENFMSAVFDLNDSKELFEREKNRFLRSLNSVTDEVPGPKRTQNRLEENAGNVFVPRGEFDNTPDTDPSLSANRIWGREILERSKTTTLGIDTLAVNEVDSNERVEELIDETVAASKAWGALSGKERGDILRKVGIELAVRRDELLEVMAFEAGKTLEQGDTEVSEAIDFAYYYAMLAEKLEEFDGAIAHPVNLTLVIPPWNFPTAIPTGGVLAALAAGSGVIFKPASNTARTGAVIADILWDAGVPREVFKLAKFTNRDAGQHLVAHKAVDRLILTGGYETAEMFRSWRKDLPLFGETSGKNSIIVTPNADLDLAVKDVVYSAFGHAGQKCSAASTVILVGSVATSKRFKNQLLDAVRSLHVAYPQDIESQMGPIISEPEGKLLRGLTTLEAGESWAIEPKKLDDTGKLWSPGVRVGVKPGSEYHLTEYFGPILGIMTAKTLEEAIELQNAPDYGLTAGLHSLDSKELDLWLSKVQAGNLYVNRGITGAIVRRQPFGGWKKSTVGSGTKAGGPSYLVALSDWESAESTATQTPSVAGVREALASLREPTAGTIEDLEYLTRATSSDAEAWALEFGAKHDPSQLGVERNILRYVPQQVQVRLDSTGQLMHGIRVVLAGIAAGAPVELSTAQEIPVAALGAIENAGVKVVVEDDATYRANLAELAHKSIRELESTALGGSRIRYIGTDAYSVYEALGGRPDIAVYTQPVTESGRVEMLPFVKEQAVSITAHRFGNPDHFSEGII